MKERILRGWTLQRMLFLLMGVAVIIQAVMEREWFAIFFGGYFAAMGLFRFGCASGMCYPLQQHSASAFEAKEEVIHEEIK